jgi:hypothetical protein
VNVLPVGAFVWTNFPFGHPPKTRSEAGPSPHIAYHLGSDAMGLVMLADTRSGRWRGAAIAKPPSIVEFTGAEAVKLNQKAFHIDLRTLAKVRLTAAWFPRWADRDRGIVGIADAAVQGRILQAAKALAGRPETIEIRGIGSSTTTSTRRPGSSRA